MPYEVCVDTYSRSWSRRFVYLDDAAAYFLSLRPRARFSAELRFRGQRVKVRKSR